MLTPACLALVARELAPRGELTIVTDNLSYGRQLARDAAAHGGYRTVSSAGADEVFREGAVALVRGLPPNVGKNGASYFGRLWTSAERAQRYYVRVRADGAEARAATARRVEIGETRAARRVTS